MVQQLKQLTNLTQHSNKLLHVCSNSNFCSKMSTFKVQPADRIKKEEQSFWVPFIALAKETESLNLGVGFPNYSPPDFILKNLANVAASSDPLLNQYTRAFGHPRLVNAMAKLYSHLLARTIDPMSNILVTSGAYNALFYAVNAFINPGDEAIIIEPSFDSYEPMVRMAGGICKFAATKIRDPSKANLSSSDFELDFNELESLFSSKTKLIFLNNPNNPSGKVFTMEELTKIANLVKKYNIMVISDEVYEWMIYPDNKMIRFATLPDMWERTITIGSAGKTFNVTGWKIGWAIAPQSILGHMCLLHQNCVYTCPTPLQEAIARSLEHKLDRFDSSECYFHSLAPNELMPKRDRMANFLKGVGMNPIIPDGGYFILAECSNLHGPLDVSGDKSDEPRDFRFVRWLAKEKKIAGVPPSAFYGKDHRSLAANMIRFCFFKTDSTLDAAEKIMKRWAATK